MATDQLDAEPHRWSRDAVERRLATMAPADALLTVELYNARHPAGSSVRLETCLDSLTAGEAADVRSRVAVLQSSAMEWGWRYWAKRLAEARQGTPYDGDEEIMAEMSQRHPGFSRETLIDVYNIGLMLAR